MYNPDILWHCDAHESHHRYTCCVTWKTKSQAWKGTLYNVFTETTEDAFYRPHCLSCFKHKNAAKKYNEIEVKKSKIYAQIKSRQQNLMGKWITSKWEDCWWQKGSKSVSNQPKTLYSRTLMWWTLLDAMRMHTHVILLIQSNDHITNILLYISSLNIYLTQLAIYDHKLAFVHTRVFNRIHTTARIGRSSLSGPSLSHTCKD